MQHVAQPDLGSTAKQLAPPRFQSKPVLAPLLRSRRAAISALAIAVAQIGLVAAGLPAWSCPVKTTLGIPCPGCGLTTAIVLLLRGEWRASFTAHAFAPLFLAGFAAVAAAGLLPGPSRDRAVNAIAELERRTGLVLVVLLALVVYWGLRLSKLV